MSVAGKGAVESSVHAVQIVATGTPWERHFDLGIIAYKPPAKAWLKRLLWEAGEPARKRHKARIDAEIAAYRAQIAKEGCTPDYMARVMAERGLRTEVR